MLRCLGKKSRAAVRKQEGLANEPCLKEGEVDDEHEKQREITENANKEQSFQPTAPGVVTPLDINVIEGESSAAEVLKQHYKDDTSTDNFLRAARAGNLPRLLELLETTDINVANANDFTALHLAAKEGHTKVVEDLLKRGANAEACTIKGNTALHIACLAGRYDVVKLLIQKGVKVNVQSQSGFSPLYMAAQENHIDVVKLLLDNGASQTLATEDGFTPLAVALQQGHDQVVSLLNENDFHDNERLPAPPSYVDCQSSKQL